MDVADSTAAGAGQNPTRARPSPRPAPVAPVHPGAPRPPGATVLRAVPGTVPEWVSAADRISFLLVALAVAEMGGRAQPEPLHAGRALRAWARLKGPVLEAVRAAPASTPGAVLVTASDVATLGATAQLLGSVLCAHQVHGTDDGVARALIAEARTQGSTPGGLVAQLTRVHGVLDVEPSSGPALALVRAIWRAGD